MLAFTPSTALFTPAAEHFDGKPGELVASAGRTGEPRYDAATPDRFTYDPLTRRSHPNSASLRVAGGRGKAEVVTVPVPAAPTAGFTLEFFARPEGFKGQSGQYFPLVTKARKSDAAASCRVNVFVTHDNYVYDLTIDTGAGNPGAVGFDYQGHNNSAVYNLLIRGTGVHGLDLMRPWPGPCLVKDVRIEGFDHGVRAGWNEYSVTLSRLHLKGQKVAGITNGSNGLCVEGLTSENVVPAVVNGGGGQVVLINSKLPGGDPKTEAVVNPKAGSLFARNVTVSGYAGGDITELSTGAGKSLNLPVEQPPAVPWGTPKEWANVRDYEHLVTKDGDWAPAIQAAIDGGAKTVYFPVNGAAPRYLLKSPVRVRGAVVRLFGMQNGLDADDKTLAGQPAVVFESAQPAVSVERLNIPSALHSGACDLIVTCGGINRLDATAGCGRLFLEDFLPALQLNKHQRVWARHLNIETRDTKIVNDGGRLWVLGYKTEERGCNLLNTNGARTEILGGLMYVTDKPAKDVPMFENRDSDLTLVHLTSGYVGMPELYAREVRNGTTKELKPGDVQQWLNGRPLVHLYTSRREGK